MTMTLEGVAADLERLGFKGYASAIRAHLRQPAQSVDVGNLRGDLQSIASGMFPDGDCADVAAMLWAEKWLAALQEKGNG